jgi:nucleoside-diphosphate-sugar epimerase
MKAVVTGAGGYLGPVVIQMLLAADPANRVVAVSRDPRGSLLLFAAATDRVTAMTPDEFLAAGHGSHPADAVIHLAAGGRTNGDAAALAASMRFTRRVIEWCLTQQVPRLIFASSQAVYGTAPTPWREEMPAAPVTLYGGYKYSTELLLETLRSAGAASLHPLSLRFGKLVGPSPRFRISDLEWPHVLVHAALTGHTATLPAAGAQLIDLVDIRDAAAAILAALARSGEPVPPALNVGSGHPTTVREVAELVAAIAATDGFPPLRFTLQPPGPGPLRSFAMATDLAERSLGFRVRIPLQQTIRDLFTLLARGATGRQR